MPVGDAEVARRIEILAARTTRDLVRRNDIFLKFFGREALRLANASQEMAQRFLAGGRLLAFGRGAATTDAQHVAVEFVHPVIVGKRALPALDLGTDFSAQVSLLLRPGDMVMGFGMAPDDADLGRVIAAARSCGALTFGLPGEGADYSFDLPDSTPFISQEVFEVLYHLLWETVHVYFEHREQGHDVGAASFLYPFLGKQEQPLGDLVESVRTSMLQKVVEVNTLRATVAEQASALIAELTTGICARLSAGGKVITFGNGGSATDANDFAFDLMMPPEGLSPLPALSLSSEAATITAIANDISSDDIFSRQLIAHAEPQDVAIGFSTSGNSPNILAALVEARKRGLCTVGVAGYGGGKVAAVGVVDYAVVIPSDYIPRIQEVQASVYHVLRCRMDEVLRGGDLLA